MSTSRANVILLAVLLAACSRSGGPAATVSPSPSPTSADPSRPLPSPVPSVVARINGQPVLLTQILPLARAELERVPSEERDRRKPEVLRHALGQYVDRELLFQEALTRRIQADAAGVDWAYDQARREHRDDEEWAGFLAKQGMDPQSFRAELRIQRTVASLLEEEARTFVVPEAWSRAAYDADPASFAEPGAKGAPPFEAVRGRIEAAVRTQKREAIFQVLLDRLRARARIEIFL